jgi:uncharacterized protein YggT (Ycf19 family)
MEEQRLHRLPRKISGSDFDEVVDDKQWSQMERVVEGLLRKCDDLVRRLALRNDSVDYSVIILTTVTSGSLWLLLTQLLPITVLWVGAVLSTISTILTIYSLMSGVGKRRKNSLKLRSAIADFLAEVRGKNYRPLRDFWSEVKWFDSTIMMLERSRDE